MNILTDNLLVTIYLIAAGFTLLIAVQTAHHSRSGYKKLTYQSFAAVSLCATVDLLSTAWLYTSNDLAEAAIALKFQAAAISIWQVPFVIFVACLGDRKLSPRIYWALFLVMGSFFLLNLTMPYSLRFSTLERGADIILPWGEILPQFGGVQSLWFRLYRLIGLGVFGWAIYVAIKLGDSEKRRDSIYLASSMGLLFLAAIWGALIDFKIVASFYPVPLAFLGLVILMSFGLSQDLEDYRLANARKGRELAVAAVAFETNDAIMITNEEGKILKVNKAFEAITGYHCDEVVGRKSSLLRSGFHDRNFYENLWTSLMEKGSWEGEIWDKRKSGAIYPTYLRINSVSNLEEANFSYVAVFSDHSPHKKAEADIRHLKRTDSLTGLPNRLTFLAELDHESAKSAETAKFCGLLIVDLDKFKVLNDTLGHGYGDILLLEAAYRIKQCCEEAYTVARIGADEFGIIARNVGSSSSEAAGSLGELAEKIRKSLSEPYRLTKYNERLTASIAVCQFLARTAGSDELLKRAEIAMAQAKGNGGNIVQFFEHDMQISFENRARLEADLRCAIDRQQLRLDYQVQVDDAHRATGAEALVRWVHPERGLISPAEFIPIAEKSTLILDIGDWVLDTACRQLAEWSAQASTQDLTMSVNISAQQFVNDGFVEQVMLKLKQFSFDPKKLKLELTESIALTDIDLTVSKMRALKKDLGVQLSLDDFGTGFSSLSYLKRLPLDQIKIDQSFVRNITKNSKDVVIVKAIIDLSNAFGIEVIAEGVETEEHLTLLRQCGCRNFQGYLFSRPITAQELSSYFLKV